MRLYIAVGVGGIIGTLLRYVVSILFWTDQTTAFPWATYIVNITGAFLLTYIVFQPYFVQIFSPILFVSFTTGLLGSYTTFSMLILEVMTLWNDQLSLAIIYLLATIIGGLFASYVGYVLAHRWRKDRSAHDVH